MSASLDYTLTASKLACQALGVQPQGKPLEHDGICAFCGTGLPVGSLGAPYKRSQAFTSDALLAKRDSAWACIYCASVIERTNLLALQRVVCSAQGQRISLGKQADVVAALLDPPPAPFLWLYALGNNQHLTWTAQVSFDRNVIFACIGARTYCIRRALLPAYLEAFLTLKALAKEIAKKTKGSAKSAFITLYNPLELQWQLAPRLADYLATDPQCPASALDAYQTLLGMSAGERWALGYLATPAASDHLEQLRAEFSNT